MKVPALTLLATFVVACSPSPAPPPASPTSATTVTPAAAREPISPPVARNGMRALSLRATAVPFATYINAVHTRIHPEFTDKELAKLEKLPADHALNDMTLRTRLEVVIRGGDGTVVSAAIGTSSGVEAFDTAAVESIHRAGPFAIPPPEIVSADGNVHVDWDFSRDEKFGCAPLRVRPFLFAP